MRSKRGLTPREKVSEEGCLEKCEGNILSSSPVTKGSPALNKNEANSQLRLRIAKCKRDKGFSSFDFLPPAAFLASAFLGVTAAVAEVAPFLGVWSKRNLAISISKWLLSFCSLG